MGSPLRHTLSATSVAIGFPPGPDRSTRPDGHTVGIARTPRPYLVTPVGGRRDARSDREKRLRVFWLVPVVVVEVVVVSLGDESLDAEIIPDGGDDNGPSEPGPSEPAIDEREHTGATDDDDPADGQYDS